MTEEPTISTDATIPEPATEAGATDVHAEEAAAPSADVATGGAPAATRSVKQWLPWAIAGVALVVAGVAVAYAVQAGVDNTDASGPVSLTGKATSTPNTGGTANQGGSSSGSSSARPSGPGGSGSSGASPSGSLQSGMRAPTEAPTPLAAVGSRLATVTTPPPHTVGLLKIPEGVTSAKYSVTFKPYGWGPGGPQRGQLVVAVTKSSPSGGEAARLTDLTGKNVSLWATPAAASAIKVGGSYSGVVSVQVQGDTGRLTLVSAQPSNP